MKKLLSAILFAFIVSCASARATTLNIPNIFTPGGQITSSGFNQNFSTIQTWSTNIDSTNIGALGIYASQIIPVTSGQATFGGTQPYTFPASVLIANGVSGIGVSGTAAAGGVTCSGFDVFDETSPFTTYLCLDTNGNLGVSSAINATTTVDAYASAAAACVSLGGSGASCPGLNNSSDGGLNYNIAYSSTLGWRWLAYQSSTPTQVGQLTVVGDMNVARSYSAAGHPVAFDPRYSGVPGYHAEIGTIINVGGGGVYNVIFTIPYAVLVEGCQLTPASYSGSTPTTGVLYIQGYTGAGPPYTGLTIKNGLNAQVNVNFDCKGY